MEKGKAFASCLIPFQCEIMAARKAGMSYARIAKKLEEDHGIIVHRDTIHSFVKVRSKKRKVYKIKEVLTGQTEPMQSAQGFDFSGFLQKGEQAINKCKPKFHFDENNPIT